MKRLLVFLTVWSLYPLCAQESYMARADRFSSDSLGGLIRNQYVSVQWIGEECRWFHYTSDDADARRYWLVDTRHLAETPAVRQFLDDAAVGRIRRFITDADPEGVTALRP